MGSSHLRPFLGVVSARELFRARFGPQPEEQFGEIAHAGPRQALALGRLAERRGRGAPFQVVAPKLPFQARCHGFDGVRGGGDRPDLLAPEAAFVGTNLEVIEYPLLSWVKTHVIGWL
jgi:hypothetical protein